MASITPNRDPSGTVVSCRFRVCTGRDERGIQQFATKTVKPPLDLTPAKAMKEMQRQADVWGEKVQKGIVPVKRHTFQEFAEVLWWQGHVLNGEHKPRTVEFYRTLMRRVVVAFGAKPLDQVRSVDIERFLNELRNSGLSATYVRQYQTLLRTMYNYAERHDLVERNPMRKVASVKKVPKPIDFLDQAQVRAFLSALREAPLSWRCMMTLLLLGGLRRGEAVGLQWGDVDVGNGMISIARAVSYSPKDGIVVGTPKSKHSVRTLPLPARMFDLLQAWRAEQEVTAALLPSAFVFPSLYSPYEPMHPDTVTRWLNRFMKENKLPNASPHDLRHTCGTLMLASGQASVKDCQDFLGHEDASTTLRFYASSTPDTLRRASEGLASVMFE